MFFQNPDLIYREKFVKTIHCSNFLINPETNDVQLGSFPATNTVLLLFLVLFLFLFTNTGFVANPWQIGSKSIAN
jgi:hypothetical protein